MPVQKRQRLFSNEENSSSLTIMDIEEQQDYNSSFSSNQSTFVGNNSTTDAIEIESTEIETTSSEQRTPIMIKDKEYDLVKISIVAPPVRRLFENFLSSSIKKSLMWIRSWSSYLLKILLR